MELNTERQSIPSIILALVLTVYHIMDILALTGSFPPQVGGMQKNAYEITKRLSSEHNVRILWIDNSQKKYRGDLNVYKYSIEQSRLNSGSIYLLRKTKLIRDEIKNSNPDVIYGNDISFGYSTLLIPETQNIPIVLRNPSSRFLNQYYSGGLSNFLKLRVAAKSPDAFITPSEELQRATRDITSSNVVKIPNGVDTTKFTPSVEGDTPYFDGLEDKFIILTTRRFAPKNGMRYLANAVKHTPDDVSFVMFGEGEERGQVKRILREQGESHRVKLPGAVPNNELPKYYAEADVSILPSLKEAICFSGIESFSSGTPVIGTKTGGISELIDHNENGLLIPKKDPEAIADAIVRLYEDNSLKESMSENARSKAKREYSWDSVYKRYLDVINEVSDVS